MSTSRPAAPARRHGPRPQGRAAVMAAITTAATELLAEQGPRQVTVRGIAERAHVNHALVHRHFGSKDDLLRAVLTARSEQFGRAVRALPEASPDAVLALLAGHADYWRILARFVVEAPDLLDGRSLPAGPMILGMLAGRSSGDTAGATRIAAAVAGSLALGWVVFGGHLASVLGGPDQRQVQEAVAATLRDVLARPAEGAPGRGRAAP